MDQTAKARPPQKQDADTKLAQQRLGVLELAKELGNVGYAVWIAPASTNGSLDLSRLCSGLLRAILAMKETEYGNDTR